MDLLARHIRLRGLRVDDAPRLVELQADPDIGKYLATWAYIPYALGDAEKFIRTQQEQKENGTAYSWAIELRGDGDLVGVTGFHDINYRDHRADWGLWIAPTSNWGQGYGYEVCTTIVNYGFHALGLSKVTLCVYEGNDRAKAMYEHAGFIVEGVLKQHIWLDGKLRDVTMMAVFSTHSLYTSPSVPATR